MEIAKKKLPLMEANLYAVSNLKVKGSELLKESNEILEKLNALDMDYTLFPKSHNPEYFESDIKREPWFYEPREGENSDSCLGIFTGPTVYYLKLHEEALEIQMLYQYSFLYHTLSNPYLEDFRKNLYQLIQIFGGDQIIFLADSGCDKLSDALQLGIWKGMSFEKVKEMFESEYRSLIRYYPKLDLSEPDYSDIREIILDDFGDRVV